MNLDTLCTCEHDMNSHDPADDGRRYPCAILVEATQLRCSCVDFTIPHQTLMGSTILYHQTAVDLTPDERPVRTYDSLLAFLWAWWRA